MKIKVVCIQTNSSKFPEKNIEMLDKIFRKITCEKINLICLPECVAIFSDEKILFKKEKIIYPDRVSSSKK